MGHKREKWIFSPKIIFSILEKQNNSKSIFLKIFGKNVEKSADQSIYDEILVNFGQ